MPFILERSQNRRSFVRNGAMITLGGMLGQVVPRAAETQNSKSLRLAILSDTHIPADRSNEYRGFKPWQNLQRIVPEIINDSPEGVLINGDAARLTGEKEDYQELKGLLAPLVRECPAYIGLGNHDHYDNFVSTMQPDSRLQAKVSNKNVIVVEHPAVRVIQLDSLLYVNKVAGLLGREQRAWLNAFLSESDKRPTVLFVHHTLGDGDGDLLDADRLFGILRLHSQVKAVFYGHSHRYEYGKRDGLHLVNLPAVGYNFNDAQPVGWLGANFDQQGVALTLHAFGGNMADDAKTVRLNWNG